MESMREFSDRIANALESGSRPWGTTDAERGLPRRFDGQAFDGASVIALWMTGTEKGFERPTWLGRERIDEMGGRLKAGATPGTAWLRVRRPRRLPGPEGGLATTEAWQPRDVWCVDEIDGLPDHLYRRAEEFFVRPAVGEEIWDHVDPDDNHGHYAHFDEVPVDEGRVLGMNAAYLTTGAAARDFIRWTASPARMNRDLAEVDEGLVVEIGAAILMADFRVIDYSDLDNSRFWWKAGKTVRRIREDDAAVFRAGAHASEAVEWVRREALGYRAFSGMASWGLFMGDTMAGMGTWGWGSDAVRGHERVAAGVRWRIRAALEFRHRPVEAGDDGTEWRRLASRRVEEVTDIDLDAPGARAAVEAEVALAAAHPDEVVSAETFVADFVEGTRRRLAMFEATTQRTRAMSLGESAQRI